MRTAFIAELQGIQADIEAQMTRAAAVLTGLRDALAQPDPARGAELQATGQELRGLARDTDVRLVRLSAMQAPVACDLRLVLTMMQLCQHQGLIANQFVLIGEQLAAIDPSVTDRCATTDKVGELTELACRQLKAAAVAFAQRDAGRVEDVCRGDDRLNRLNREICRASLETRAGPEQRELAFRHVLIARSLERIGDNAVGIARRTAELLEADVHHLALAHS